MISKYSTFKQFFLIIDGPSCGGKSSVADEIQSRISKVFNARQDRVKWLISDYKSGRYTDVLGDIMFSMMNDSLKHGLSVIKEGVRDRHDEAKKLAKKYKVPLFIVNVSAPKDVLLARFKERVDAKKNGARVSNVDPKRFENLRKMYEDNKEETHLEFDTSVSSSSEIAKKIIKHIKHN